jgi:hypothetical protein
VLGRQGRDAAEITQPQGHWWVIPDPVLENRMSFTPSLDSNVTGDGPLSKGLSRSPVILPPGSAVWFPSWVSPPRWLCRCSVRRQR